MGQVLSVCLVPRTRGLFGASLVVLLVLSTGSCAMGRSGGDYRSFVASHDAIRPGMSMRQVFEVGLADYLDQTRQQERTRLNGA